MNESETQLWINDYLDLYLYAKSIDDHLWQQEIIKKLKTSHQLGSKRNPVDSKSY